MPDITVNSITRIMRSMSNSGGGWEYATSTTLPVAKAAAKTAA